MRYVLLFSDGTITIGANDLEGKYCVWGRKGWRAAVGDLAKLVESRPREGKITNLEVQSHGSPGRIVVGGKEENDINNDTVATFGAMLRPIMAPGGLIEIMACKVASFSRATFEDGPIQYSPAIVDGYFGGIETAAVYLDKVDGNAVVIPYQGERLANFKKLIAKCRTQRMSSRDNGLKFCLTLARTSGAIVRAAMLSQAEEIGDFDDGYFVPHWTQTHPISRDFDRFGDWEGPVWDFMPNGVVKYLGSNLPRHNVRFPKQPVGPQLTYNFREQGGNSAAIGQRPQRMNRSPLPV